MKPLWAPWRKRYVSAKKKPRGCLFCKVRRVPSKKDPKNLLLHRSSHSFLMLNLYPYTNGHLMVVSNRHVSSTEKLKEEERLDLLRLLDRSLAILRRAFRPEGFNIGINLGRSSGAGVLGHLHVHVVPRWVGDTNFLPVFSGTKVIPDSLGGVYKTLRKIL